MTTDRSRTLLVAIARVANALFFLAHGDVLHPHLQLVCVSAVHSSACSSRRSPASSSSTMCGTGCSSASRLATLIPEWKSARGRVRRVDLRGRDGARGRAGSRTGRCCQQSRTTGVGCGWRVRSFFRLSGSRCMTIWLPPASSGRPSPTFAGSSSASAATAATVWAVNVVCLPLRSGELGDFTTTWTGVAFGALTSLGVHVGVFVGVRRAVRAGALGVTPDER